MLAAHLKEKPAIIGVDLFWGFVYDPIENSMVKFACQELLSSTHPTKREVARVIAIPTANFPGVMYGPAHCRHLDMDKILALKAHAGNYDKCMTILEAANSE